MPKRGKGRSSRYVNAIRRIAKATDRPYRFVATTYKGEPEKLFRASRTDFPKIALARRIYESRIAATREQLGVSYKLATHFDRTVTRISKGRVEGRLFQPAERVKGTVIAEQFADAIPIRKGPSAGKYRVYYDTATGEIVTPKKARSMRNENRIERQALAMFSDKWGKYRKLHKFYSKADLKKIRSRKDHKPTLAETRRAAKRMAKKWNQSLYDTWVEIFGGSA